MPKKEGWPQRREIVLGTVTKVNPFSAFVSLDEYENTEGMIHISEVAGKWVRDIRKFVKPGQKVVALVMRTDKQKGHITLSLKRVKKYDSEKKMKEYKREIKAEKMLQALADKNKISLDDVYKDIGFQLQEIFGEVFKAFHMSLTDRGYEMLIKKGVSEKWAKQIKQVADEQMELKEVDIKGEIELKCYQPDGVSVIKNILKDAKKKHDIEVKYISAPKYSIFLKTKDAKSGEKKLKKVGEEIIKRIEECNGEGSLKVD
ncbi:MAG: translation initiation factor IF-2 subunit alpha [Candidatus Aenigmarchaeota archaeon]|nr:translation initiation factor IF-2 subunit alpha [Candidatus Aenigmarchaeota archaeon]